MIDLFSFFVSPLIPVWSTSAVVGRPSYFKEQSNRKMSKISDPSALNLSLSSLVSVNLNEFYCLLDLKQSLSYTFLTSSWDPCQFMVDGFK